MGLGRHTSRVASLAGHSHTGETKGQTRIHQQKKTLKPLHDQHSQQRRCSSSSSVQLVAAWAVETVSVEWWSCEMPLPVRPLLRLWSDPENLSCTNMSRNSEENKCGIFFQPDVWLGYAQNMPCFLLSVLPSRLLLAQEYENVFQMVSIFQSIARNFRDWPLKLVKIVTALTFLDCMRLVNMVWLVELNECLNILIPKHEMYPSIGSIISILLRSSYTLQSSW